MDGVITEYAAPGEGAAPNLLAAGVDGRMWFTELDASRIAAVGTGRGPLLSGSVVGNAQVGSTLRCTSTNDSGWAVESTARTWLRNSAVIPNATGRSYVVRGRDRGANISCRVSVTFGPALNQMTARSKSVRVR